jgi:hypothetical protein
VVMVMFIVRGHGGGLWQELSAGLPWIGRSVD